MGNQTRTNKKGLSIKDLVTIGIFTALLFVTMLVGGIVFAPNPVLTFYMPLGAALLGGPVMMLLIAKVPKSGAIAIAGILCGVIWFATGMHWAMDLGYIVGGIIGDLIAGIGKYKNKFLNMLAFICLSLGATGTYICYFANRNTWSNYMLNGGTSKSYIDAMNTAAKNWMLAVILIGTVVVAGMSAWIGSILLKKQFEKAGITA
ncbi:energy-coupling factor transport system substrate-specific component [Lachnotalea glycerini]|uniref:Energy-coupling factor transport system substrate-specific component n=1 Tax=Lachnotalea glycerini TaxID=1763509 RepID=A0A255I4Z8_9FIRM|nr:MptD family putative ECF transporter S component [Lachnotalea glycerini]PXV95897.1 energy-coupling factor transport system substrate-specific component [Lachnotalea glycerini]RDY33054.1 Trep_Strep domain-containing protein [Lachnotalea glycerini]